MIPNFNRYYRVHNSFCSHSNGKQLEQRNAKQAAVVYCICKIGKCFAALETQTVDCFFEISQVIVQTHKWILEQRRDIIK